MSAAERSGAFSGTAVPRAALPFGLSPRRLLELMLPVVIFIAALLAWEAYVDFRNVPHYVLPAPSRIGRTIVTDWPILRGALLVTLRNTITALAEALLGGTALAIIFAQSKWIERSFFPFAVVLQVTPIVSIAPLLLIYLDPSTAVRVCAFLVAFFPILSNTALGLASTDHNLIELMDLYGASRWQQMVYLRLPAALPQFLGGLRIGGGLALIGAVVAEIAAGSAGQGAGLAVRIVEAGFRLRIPRMFAALALIAATGILIYAALSWLSHLLLHKWHDSARQRGA